MEEPKYLGFETCKWQFDIICLENDKSTSFDVKNIAKDFGPYFSNLAENLVNKLPNPSDKYNLLSVARYDDNLGMTKKFDLLPTEKDRILKILRDVDTLKPAGIDRLPRKLLKGVVDILSKPGSDICNFSVSLSKSIGAFKLAKVKPLFKKDRNTNASNHQPISILSLLSKVIETIPHKQTRKFLNNKNIFYEYQSSFRSNHSTDLLPFLKDKIFERVRQRIVQ